MEKTTIGKALDSFFRTSWEVPPPSASVRRPDPEPMPSVVKMATFTLTTVFPIGLFLIIVLLSRH